MKKIKLFVVAFLGMFLFFGSANALENPINVYIFKSSSCPHCAEAMEFFESLESDSEYQNYFELVPFETYGSDSSTQENVKLAQKVAKYFGKDFEGVPLIVIGDEYYEGFSSDMEEELKSVISSAYHNSNYDDIVAGIQDGTLKGSNFDAIMSVMIVVVLAGGIGYFIYAARKNVVFEEEMEEPVKEENKVEVKEEKTKSSTKTKTTTKKTPAKTNATKKNATKKNATKKTTKK